VGASVVGSLGIVQGPGTFGAGAALGLGSTVSIANTQSPYTVPAGIAAVRILGGIGAQPVQVNLPSALFGTCVDGQIFVCNSFDQSGNTITLVPATGDNIDGGIAHYMSFYGSVCALKARVAGSVTNWTYLGQNSVNRYVFPLQPALTASMTNVSIGAVVIPQGVMSIRAAWLILASNLTAGQISATLGAVGLSASHTLTLSTTGTSATGQLVSPGSANWLTVPQLASGSIPSGAIINGTISTTAAFAGATQGAVMIETY
jgi:hypothetical protein